ncbi:hypothetical protein, partial [Paenibacillus xylanexedens]|uniref:hypothetical protein n=1 Tax=Paenibacillus xylanexedens TaxID=528191 RepID=UPI0021B4CDA6
MEGFGWIVENVDWKLERELLEGMIQRRGGVGGVKYKDSVEIDVGVKVIGDDMGRVGFGVGDGVVGSNEGGGYVIGGLVGGGVR